MGKNIWFSNPSDFLTKNYPYAYADSTLKLYRKMDTATLIQAKTKFFCLKMTKIVKGWAHVVTTIEGDCEDSTNTGAKEAWIIWYDKKLLIRPQF